MLVLYLRNCATRKFSDHLSRINVFDNRILSGMLGRERERETKDENLYIL